MNNLRQFVWSRRQFLGILAWVVYKIHTLHLKCFVSDHIHRTSVLYRSAWNNFVWRFRSLEIIFIIYYQLEHFFIALFILCIPRYIFNRKLTWGIKHYENWFLFLPQQFVQILKRPKNRKIYMRYTRFWFRDPKYPK